MRPTHHRPRRLATLAGVLIATIAIFALDGLPASADPLPLSAPPTAELNCETDGTSTLTIHWPAGEYGTWLMRGGAMSDVSGPGAVNATPTDEVFAVADGWTAQTSTFRLNRDTDGDTAYNETHVSPTGSTCPFETSVTATHTCATGTLQTTIAAGHVTRYQVFDDTTNAPLSTRTYPRYNLFGVLVDPVPVGPVTLSATVPNTVARVRIEVTVNNTVLTTTRGTDCPRGCAQPIGWWANASLPGFPVQTLTVGSVTYTAAQAQTYIKVGYLPIQTKLRRELITAKLNQARGASYPGLQALIDAADASLTQFPTDTGMSSTQRTASQNMKSQLDLFDRGLVAGVPACPCS